jgi:2-methylaconitate cis-trans-isomerase PrpF
MKKILIDKDGVKEVDLTAEEIAQREAEEAEALANPPQTFEKLDEIKATAKEKLMAGEALTEEEANVLVGV